MSATAQVPIEVYFKFRLSQLTRREQVEAALDSARAASAAKDDSPDSQVSIILTIDIDSLLARRLATSAKLPACTAALFHFSDATSVQPLPCPFAVRAACVMPAARHVYAGRQQ